MCKRCSQQFTIHSVGELIELLSYYDLYDGQQADVLELWRQRRYFDNLVYLEYLYAKTL